MALREALVSARFPYLPVHLEVGRQRWELEAFVDTGFDGHLAVPEALAPSSETPAGYLPCVLADGSELSAPYYRGAVTLGGLGPFRVPVLVLGHEPFIGRALTDRFKLTFDHGQRVVLEP